MIETREDRVAKYAAMTDSELVKQFDKWLGKWRYEYSAEGRDYNSQAVAHARYELRAIETVMDERGITVEETSEKYPGGITYCLVRRYYDKDGKEIIAA